MAKKPRVLTTSQRLRFPWLPPWTWPFVGFCSIVVAFLLLSRALMPARDKSWLQAVEWIGESATSSKPFVGADPAMLAGNIILSLILWFVIISYSLHVIRSSIRGRVVLVSLLLAAWAWGEPQLVNNFRRMSTPGSLASLASKRAEEGAVLPSLQQTTQYWAYMRYSQLYMGYPCGILCMLAVCVQIYACSNRRNGRLSCNEQGSNLGNASARIEVLLTMFVALALTGLFRMELTNKAIAESIAHPPDIKSRLAADAKLFGCYYAALALVTFGPAIMHIRTEKRILIQQLKEPDRKRFLQQNGLELPPWRAAAGIGLALIPIPMQGLLKALLSVLTG